MPRILVYANCQVGPVHRLIERAAPHLEVVRTLPVHTVPPEGIADVQALVQSADIVLAQPIGPDFGELRSEALMALPGHREWITFPSIHFGGLFPHLFKLRLRGQAPLRGPLADYHDRRIVKGFLAGLTVEECAARMPERDVEACRRHFDESLAESTRREADLPIKVMDYVKEHVTTRRTFHTFNHPDNGVMWQVVRQFLRLIGEPMSVEQPPVTQYLGEISAAIPDEMAEAVGLGYSDSAYRFKGEALPIGDLVASYYALYAATPDFQALCDQSMHAPVG